MLKDLSRHIISEGPDKSQQDPIPFVSQNRQYESDMKDQQLSRSKSTGTIKTKQSAKTTANKKELEERVLLSAQLMSSCKTYNPRKQMPENLQSAKTLKEMMIEKNNFRSNLQPIKMAGMDTDSKRGVSLAKLRKLQEESHSPRATMFNKQSDIIKKKNQMWYNTLGIIADNISSGFTTGLSPLKRPSHLGQSPNQRPGTIQVFK